MLINSISQHLREIQKGQEAYFSTIDQFAKYPLTETETEWLGYIFTQAGVSPLKCERAASLTFPPPNIIKRLRSFLGSVQYISKFFPNLTELYRPF